MSKKSEFEVLDSKQQVLDKLGVYSEKDLSNESVFRRLISIDAIIDKEVLGAILPKIDNFSDLVAKQQEFISEMAEKQKKLDENALVSFNKTKEIISEIIKNNPNMDKELMIYLVESLKKWISLYPSILRFVADVMDMCIVPKRHRQVMDHHLLK